VSVGLSGSHEQSYALDSQLFSSCLPKHEGKEAKERNKERKQQQPNQSDSGLFFLFENKSKKTTEKTTGSFKSSSILVGCRKHWEIREGNNNHNVTSKLFQR
jgi:hypothetical protein